MNNGLLYSRESETIEGLFRLDNLLSTSGENAVYETRYGESGQLALIELRRADAPDAAERLHRWREATELFHPNLIRLHAAGNSELNGVPVIYLVMERADESLAGVLAERELSPEEAREMLEPALSALSYLHEKGYAHTGLDPAHILAIGETLKLSSEGVRRVDQGALPEEDMFALGTVLAQALTRDVPKFAKDSEPYVSPGVPEPFGGIVRHCLEPDPKKRWSATQALAHLRAEPAPLPMAFQHSVKPGGDVPDYAPESPAPSHAGRKVLYGAVAALLAIFAVVAVTGLKPKTAQPPAVAPPEIAPRIAVANAPPPAAAPQLRPPETPSLASTPPERPVEKKAVTSGDRRADGWAVVVAAYGARGPAQKRAREIEKKWPRFNAKIFEPASEKARHLVVLGTNLSEDDAESLRQRAIAAGLPRDAYIKRFAPGPG